MMAIHRRLCLTAAATALAFPVSAAVFSSTQSGNYNANATWGVASNPGGGGGNDDVTVNDAHTVLITVNGDAATDTITVLTGGELRSTIQNGTPFQGSTIRLDGGTLSYRANGGFTGGDVDVLSSSRIQLDRNSGNTSTTHNFDSLTMTGDGSVLTFARGGGATDGTATARFTGVQFVNDATFAFDSAGTNNVVVELTDVTLAADKTFTLESSNGSIGRVRLLGDNTGTLQGTIVVNNATRLEANSGTSFVNLLDAATVVVNTGGRFETRLQGDNLLAGNTVVLDGGLFQYDNINTGSPVAPGGDFVVRENGGTFDVIRSGGGNAVVHTFGSLAIDADNNPTLGFINTNTDNTQRSVFVGSTIENSFTADISVTNRTAVTLRDTRFATGATLSKTGDNNLTIDGNLGVKLAGSAQLLDSNSFTLVTANGNLTKSFTEQTDNGLWSFGGDATTISATLDKDLGSLAVGDALNLAGSFDSGFVTLTGLTSGEAYSLVLGLDNFTTDVNAVVAELLTNPGYDSVTALGVDGVQLDFTSFVTGDLFFAWENVNSLGANITNLALQVPGATDDPAAAAVPEPTSAVLAMLALTGLATRRRRRNG